MASEMNTQQKERYEDLRKKSQKMKKRILIIFGALVALILILFGSIVLIERLLTGSADKTPKTDYEFYPEYEGNILTFEEYLELDRQVYYCNDPSGYGLTQAVTLDNRKDFDENVLFLFDFIQTIINGDAEGYNACFNDTFFKAQEPKQDFSQQMVYNIEITFQSKITDTDGSELVTYRLEYMIHRNDGSFRRDVGSDAIRPQTVTLRVSNEGQILIEKLLTHYGK